MTDHAARIAAIQKLGYTDQQATFLLMVVLHSGYFLRRQYDFYRGNEKGGTGQRLIEQLIGRRHAKLLTFCDKTTVCHLCSRPFYRVVGEENSRNRRVHQPFAVKAKLMALDFILNHPDAEFVASERERIALFAERLGLPIAVLPSKCYVSKSHASRTVRYFVDRNPIFLSAAAPGAARSVTFAYVDSGGDTTAGFRSYLVQYRRLFEALASFRVVYVASHSRLVSAARKDFWKVLRPDSGPGAGQETGAAGLLAHLEARLRHEHRDYFGLDAAGIKRLSRELKEFSGPKYDALFELYKAQGTERVLAEMALEATSEWPGRGTFKPCVLEYSYAFLGDECAV